MIQNVGSGLCLILATHPSPTPRLPCPHLLATATMQGSWGQDRLRGSSPLRVEDKALERLSEPSKVTDPASRAGLHPHRLLQGPRWLGWGSLPCPQGHTSENRGFFLNSQSQSPQSETSAQGLGSGPSPRRTGGDGEAGRTGAAILPGLRLGVSCGKTEMWPPPAG